jgi:hypothetical protein
MNRKKATKRVVLRKTHNLKGGNMRKILAIAIVLVMVIPVSIQADAEEYDYTQTTPQLAIIASNINAGNIFFDNANHRQSFLSDISSVYSYRSGEDWSVCSSLLEDLANDAKSWITDATVANNVSIVCNCEAVLYDEYYDDLACVMIEDGVLEQVEDNTNGNNPLLVSFVDDGLPDYVHFPNCDWYPDLSTYNVD